MRVLDASALVDLVARTPRGRRVARALTAEPLVAPELIDIEVLSAVACLARARIISDEHADTAVERLLEAPIERVPHEQLTPRAWRLRHQVRITDAYYVACAQGFGCALITCDARLVRAAVPGLSVLLIS